MERKGTRKGTDFEDFEIGSSHCAGFMVEAGYCGMFWLKGLISKDL